MTIDSTTLEPFVIGLVGVAVGWGATWGAAKARLNEASAKIDELTRSWNVFQGMGDVPGSLPIYIRRSECLDTKAQFHENFIMIDHKLQTQHASIKRLENYVRYQLTVKDGMSLPEANAILENGK
jgi:hypothetical protein